MTEFNEGELSVYKSDEFYKSIQLILLLSPSESGKMPKKNRAYLRKRNIDRRTRRQKLVKEQQKEDLLREEGGNSYKFSFFGSETFSNSPKKVLITTRQPCARRTEVARQYDDPV